MIDIITVSIVSHGHVQLVSELLTDLEKCPEVAEVIVTHNISEPSLELNDSDWLKEINNSYPKGFGANHNAAFSKVQTPYFVVLNPDIRLLGNPFPVLLDCMERSNAALCAPAVVNTAGELEDSARYFPSPLSIALKLLRRCDGSLSYDLGDAPVSAPWVGGMFMLLSSVDYSAVSGFDERFFLYYEDVDLCARLHQRGRPVMLCPGTSVVHDARRASWRNRRHRVWHMASMARYFWKYYWYSYHRLADL